MSECRVSGYQQRSERVNFELYNSKRFLVAGLKVLCLVNKDKEDSEMDHTT